MSPSTLSLKCHQPAQEKAGNAAFEWSGGGVLWNLWRLEPLDFSQNVMLANEGSVVK